MTHTYPTTRLADLPVERRQEIADQLLTRYLGGEQIRGMAAEMKVSHTSLYALLLKEREEDWKDGQVARALATLEDSEASLRNAKDGLELAKARELLRSAQWTLEKICRRIFGNDVAAPSGGQIQINIGLVRERKIEDVA